MSRARLSPDPPLPAGPGPITSSGMFRLPNRAILRLSGPDTHALLERTVTHRVTDWAPGEMRYGALLTPQGKVIADYLACADGEDVLIDVHEEAAEDLIRRLTLFRLRARVAIGRDETHVSATGPQAGPDPRDRLLPGRRIIPVQDITGEQDPGAWRAARIRAGIPEWGDDYRAAEVFPTDINMDLAEGIDYRKGCFVGQEVASRMKRKALIRRRTVRLSLPGAAAGQRLSAGPAEIGEITSACQDDALALIRLDRLARALKAGDPLMADAKLARLCMTGWLEEEMNAHLSAGADG